MQVGSVRAAACHALGHRLLIIFLAVTAIGVVMGSPSPITQTQAAVRARPIPWLSPRIRLRWTPWVRDGRVETITQVGDVVVLGGDFTTVSPHVRKQRSLARLSLPSTLPRARYSWLRSGSRGPVYSLAPGPRAGTVYVGGGIHERQRRYPQVTGVTRAVHRRAEHRLAFSVHERSRSRLVLVEPADRRRNVHAVRSADPRWSRLGQLDHGRVGPVDDDQVGTEPQLDHWQHGRKAPVGVEDFDLSRDGHTLVVVGNFRTAGGLRATKSLCSTWSGAAPTVRTDWATTAFSSVCSSRSFDSWVRDVDVAPDGSYFVVATTGGPYPGTLCDTGSRWELGVSVRTPRRHGRRSRAATLCCPSPSPGQPSTSAAISDG